MIRLVLLTLLLAATAAQAADKPPLASQPNSWGGQTWSNGVVSLPNSAGGQTYYFPDRRSPVRCRPNSQHGQTCH